MFTLDALFVVVILAAVLCNFKTGFSGHELMSSASRRVLRELVKASSQNPA